MKPPCKEGDRVKLLAMGPDPDPIAPGSTGTVIIPPVYFQTSWQISVKWDDGRSLSLCSPPDRFEVIA